jgi:hypothetical protein
MENFMHMGITEIIVACITAITTGFGAWLTYKSSVKKHEAEIAKVSTENTAIKREMEVQRTALGGFGGMMQEFSQVETEIQNLCLNTDITRVVVLCAWNGKYSPKWTTAVWQYRELKKDGELQRPVNYIHVGLDDDYVARLINMKNNGSTLFKTEEAKDTLIGRIYDSEDITESLWCFLSAADTADHDGRLITYMSFATAGGKIDRKTRLSCELLAGRLAPLTGKVDLKD